MKKLLAIILTVIALFAILATSYVYAQEPPAYVYMAQDRSTDATSPTSPPYPKKNFVMGEWAIQNQSLWWYADDQIENFCATAISNWETAFPELDWTVTQQSWLGEASFGVAQLPAGIPGVTLITAYYTPGNGENALYSYNTVVAVNSDYGYIEAGMLGVLAHEIGHHYGLHERYLSDGSCNPNEVSVMDTVQWELQQGVVVITAHCDGLAGPGPEPQSDDRPRIRAFWYEGLYTDWTAQANGAIATFTWKDASWAEQKHEIQVFYSNGQGWQYYFGNNIYQDIGLHKTIENRTITQVLNVTQYGAPLQTWHCACGRPWLEGSNRYGTWTCESMYMP